MVTPSPSPHPEEPLDDGALHNGIEAQTYPTAEDQLKIHDDRPDQSEPAKSIKPSESIKPAKSIKPPDFYHSIIRVDHGDLMLFACSFCTGLIDSSTFIAYTTFVSMQTGNTIFLTLAISVLDPKPDAWARPFLAVILFCAGSAFFARIFIHLGSPRRRLALIINFAVQTILVVISAALIQAHIISGAVPATLGNDGKYALALVPLSLLSFQSAGQVVTSRALEVGEVPTVVITSMLCDLFSDPRLLVGPKHNVKRNRRAAGFINTFVGGVIGGVMGRKLGGIAPALWMAAGVKGSMTLAWCLWPAETPEETPKGKQNV